MNQNLRTLDAATLADLQSWVGKTETRRDDARAAPMRGLAATLDRDDAPPASGTVPPALWAIARWPPESCVT